MIKFQLKDRDEKTGVRTGVFKSNQNSFTTPNRALTSTEINYEYGLKNYAPRGIDYPNDFFLAQIKIDAESLWTRDNDYFASVIKQCQRYTARITDKTCIFKPVLYKQVREKQEDGRFKRVNRIIQNLDLELDAEKTNRIIRSIIHAGYEADFDAVTLPFLDNKFRLKTFLQNNKLAENYALKDLNSGITIISELPHSDNIDDFQMAMKEYANKNPEGILAVPHRSLSRYHFTHIAMKEFSEHDNSEKIGLVCLDAKRKHNVRDVSFPHYAMLQGYDAVVREIPKASYLREEGEDNNKKDITKIRRFIASRLSVETLDKGVFFNETEINTSCNIFKKYTYKELSRQAIRQEQLDVAFKVMETFDSHKEMKDCQVYVASNDFNDYLKRRQSLNQAYQYDFSKKQTGLGDFFK